MNKPLITSVCQKVPAHDFSNLHAPSPFLPCLSYCPMFFHSSPSPPMPCSLTTSLSESACLLTLSLANPDFLSPSPSLLQTHSLPLSPVSPISPLFPSPSPSHTQTHTHLSLSPSLVSPNSLKHN